MPIVLAALVPPGNRVKLPTETERLKLGCGMVNVTVVLLEREPEVPDTVTGYMPGTANVLALKDRALVAVALAEENVAVTPGGRAGAESATLPVKPE